MTDLRESKGDTTHKIFTSYRRKDAEDVTGHIYEHIWRRFGKDNVFKNVYSIPPGIDYRKYLSDKVVEHTEPKDWRFMDRVVENMQADEAGVKIAVFCFSRKGDSKPDIEFRLQLVTIARW